MYSSDVFNVDFPLGDVNCYHLHLITGDHASVCVYISVPGLVLST